MLIFKNPRCLFKNNINVAIEKIHGYNTSFLGRFYIICMILHEGSYSGNGMRLYFYIVARIVLFKKMILGREISL